jgi:hypothetical protein
MWREYYLSTLTRIFAEFRQLMSRADERSAEITLWRCFFMQKNDSPKKIN